MKHCVKPAGFEKRSLKSDPAGCKGTGHVRRRRVHMLHSLTQNWGVQLFLLLNIWYVINIFEILDLNIFVVHLELIVSQVSVNSPNGLRA